jgi:multidrug transporter EmrE-like cation transporter
MKGYLLLIATILIESLSIVLMKLSDGGKDKVYFYAAMFAYFLTFLGLTYTFKYLPMGWSNAVWAGSSTILVCVLGIYFFDEKITAWQAFYLLLIIIGLVGLNLSGKGK